MIDGIRYSPDQFSKTLAGYCMVCGKIEFKPASTQAVSLPAKCVPCGTFSVIHMKADQFLKVVYGPWGQMELM